MNCHHEATSARHGGCPRVGMCIPTRKLKHGFLDLEVQILDSEVQILDLEVQILDLDVQNLDLGVHILD